MNKFTVGMMVFGSIIIGVVCYGNTAWEVVNSGTFDKVEFVATEIGQTLIHFEDGTIEPLPFVRSIRFKKGDKIVVERNGCGQMRVRKLPSEEEK